MSDHDDALSGINRQAWNVAWAYCFGREAGVKAAGGGFPQARGGTQAAAFADYREQKVIERGSRNVFALLEEDYQFFRASS